MRGTRNDFDDDDDVNDENDALFFTDGEASRWWWRLCFSTSTMRPLTYSRGDGIVSGDKKTRLRARAEIEEKEDDATARGEKRRAKCARGETTDAGKVDSRSFWRTFRRRVRVARGGEILVF